MDAQPQGQPVSTPKAHREAAAEARRRSPLAKLSDKPDKSAATSHKKRRPTKGGRRGTMIRHQEGLAKPERNNQQCKPSFAIKRAKKTLLTQRVTTSRRKTQEEETGEAHTHTRSREEEPSANAQGQPERRRDSHQDQRMLKNTAPACGRGPCTKCRQQPPLAIRNQRKREEITTGKMPRKHQELGPRNYGNPQAKTRQGRARKSPRRQNSAIETPQEPNTPEQQEGPQTCDQTTPPQEQVKDQQRPEKEDQPRGAVETADPTTNWRRRHLRPEAHPP